ncbi:hypothetical protein [Mycobacterium canetti]|uniref:Terminase small subunit n=1 Tax=Mycobacterium canettii (strain CIPT 140010059) TaxID=1048245 RepID=A0AB72XIJ3_MYCCP|nr:hypothetical protein [Mycobacterium canetti]CCC43395.1 putative uncharacterised protein [Mycobacterium canettii CIPT 140010059]
MTDTNTETTTVDNGEDDTEATASDTEQVTDDPGDEEPDTFPRSYVEELRQENGRYRQRAQQADQYAQRLHTELVRATGRLADPTDLPFDAEHLDDADKMAAAIDDLLARKPHLVNRRPVGDIGQGATSSGAGTVDLAAILRQRAQ